MVLVGGPTASGKSELAVELARSCCGEIVGADSRQIYRYMDVATAKPSAEQRQAVRHHLIDVVEPDEHYDAAAWLAAAREAIAEIAARGSLPILCGGTGLYLRALLDGLFAGPAADPVLRECLESAEDACPGSLVARLQACDPESAARLHPNDRVRIIRAVEVFELTGKPITAWHQAPDDSACLGALFLSVERDRDELNARIDARAGQLAGDRLLEEMRGLRERYPGNPRAFSAIGYKEAGEVLDGELAQSALADAIAQATRRYAKRQRTWLRGRREAVLIGPDDVTGAVRRIGEFLAKQKDIS